MEFTKSPNIKLASNVVGNIVATYRIQMFGHSGHEMFETKSNEYIKLPGTQCAGIPVPGVQNGAKRYFRIEASFAANHDKLIWLRSYDPANRITDWEISFRAGHYPNSGWSWGTTARFESHTSPHLPWQRQSHLELKTNDNKGLKLGSVWIIVEDII